MPWAMMRDRRRFDFVECPDMMTSVLLVYDLDRAVKIFRLLRKK
jgi:hypothetical protein